MRMVGMRLAVSGVIESACDPKRPLRIVRKILRDDC